MQNEPVSLGENKVSPRLGSSHFFWLNQFFFGHQKFLVLQAPRQKVKAQWLDRKTQIVPVEMLAPIIALSTFESRLVGCDVLLFVDSEAVEAALVKGYSSKSDLCDLIKSKSFGTWCLNYVSGCLSIVSQRMLTLRTGLPVMILKPVLKQVGSLFDRFGLMRYAEIPRGRAWVTISMMMMCWFCFSQSV